MKTKTKSIHLTKNILFMLGFMCVFSANCLAEEDKNIISTIKNPCADFTYRMLPADKQQLYIIKVDDVEIKKEVPVERTHEIIVTKPS